MDYLFPTVYPAGRFREADASRTVMLIMKLRWVANTLLRHLDLLLSRDLACFSS